MSNSSIPWPFSAGAGATWCSISQYQRSRHRQGKKAVGFKLNTCKNHGFLMFHADFPPKNNNHWVVMVEKMGAEMNKPVTMNEELAISGCFAKTGSQRAECWNSLILQDPSLVFFHKEISRCPIIEHQFFGITVHSDSLAFPLRSQSNHLHTCSGYLYNLLYIIYIYIYVGQGYKYT